MSLLAGLAIFFTDAAGMALVAYGSSHLSCPHHAMHYQSPSWLKGGHLQTIWPLLIKGPQPRLKRRRWDTPDGDFIDIDALPSRKGRPLVVLFHGLEGSSNSHYARALMRALEELEWNGVVIHFRGCSGEPNKLARAYHSGDAAEIDWILTKLAHKYEGVPRYAVGVSLGGNALLCWLGRHADSAAQMISKAAAISAPLDLTAAGHHLGRGFNMIYTRHFLASMRKNAQRKGLAHPGSFDLDRVLRAKTLLEFDDAFTAPLHGFKDVHDYWHRSSSKPLLKDITVPTLVLNAKNDPFMPPTALPGRDEVSSMVTLEQPAEGGHVGFVSGSFPGRLDWLPDRVLAYFRQSER